MIPLDKANGQKLLELYQQLRAMNPLLIVYPLMMGPFAFYLIPGVLFAVHHSQTARMHRYVFR